MVLPTGTITFANLQTEYGGANPVGLNEYYANGIQVPIGATGIPTSGAINLNTFRGKNIAPNYVTSGIYTVSNKFGTFTYYGWLPDLAGSINDSGVVYPIYTPKFGSGSVPVTWYSCFFLGSNLSIEVDGDFRSSGPDFFRVGTQVIARTSFTRNFASGRTTLQYSTSNPFGTTVNRRVRVSNYYTAYGEAPG